MDLRNSFSTGDKAWVWSYVPYCAVCGSNQMCSVHHIYGRKGDGNNSILNGIMLCHECHSKADGHNTDDQGDPRRISYLEKSIIACTKAGYQMKPRDTRFLKAHIEDVRKVLHETSG